jgi:hypothetical protein
MCRLCSKYSILQASDYVGKRFNFYTDNIDHFLDDKEILQHSYLSDNNNWYTLKKSSSIPGIYSMSLKISTATVSYHGTAEVSIIEGYVVIILTDKNKNHPKYFLLRKYQIDNV